MLIPIMILLYITCQFYAIIGRVFFLIDRLINLVKRDDKPCR